MADTLITAGGLVFAILGLLHAIYTWADTRTPRRLVPDAPSVIEAMSSSSVRLSRGGTTMWRAWVGFNFSHSLGAVMFGVACIALGLSLRSIAPPKAVLLIPVVIGCLYLWLAIRYLFCGRLGRVLTWPVPAPAIPHSPFCSRSWPVSRPRRCRSPPPDARAASALPYRIFAWRRRTCCGAGRSPRRTAPHGSFSAACGRS